MNLSLLFLSLALVVTTAVGQEKEKERMVFQPGAPVAEGARPPGKEPAESAEKLDPTVAKKIGEFFGRLEKKEIDTAFDQLLKGTTIADKLEDATTLKTKTEQAIGIVGDVSGSEQLGVSRVGTRLLCTTYLSFNREFPLRWQFYFYKTGDAWKLVDIQVSLRLADMFGESARIESKSGTWPKP